MARLLPHRQGLENKINLCRLLLPSLVCLLRLFQNYFSLITIYKNKIEDVLHKAFPYLATIKMAYVLVKTILYSEQELVWISLKEILKRLNAHVAVSRDSQRLKERTQTAVPSRPRVKHCPHNMIPRSGRIPACHSPKPRLPCLPVGFLPPLARAAATPAARIAVGAPHPSAFPFTLAPVRSQQALQMKCCLFSVIARSPPPIHKHTHLP